MSDEILPPRRLSKEAIEFIVGFEGVGTGVQSRDIESIDRVACSDCFRNEGLRLDAEIGGIAEDTTCPRCGSQTGRKLTRPLLETLAHRFFVRGSFARSEYGAAPIIQFNDRRPTDIKIPRWLDADIRLFEQLLGVGFFYYGPRTWMIGEIVPLEQLQSKSTRISVLERIFKEYPTTKIGTDQVLYRLRTNPSDPSDIQQFDSPPAEFLGRGRLDTTSLPILYASQDIEVCIHECRATAEDELYVATLVPKRELKLLDLTALLATDETEFESLDMAVHMLFLAGRHSYEIARDIASSASAAGYDGVIYPSYFSLLRTGGLPFETVYGISHRRIAQFSDHERSKTVPNLGIFGRPIAEGVLEVKCINRLVLERVAYQFHFGPAGFQPSLGTIDILPGLTKPPWVRLTQFKTAIRNIVKRFA